MIGVTLLMIISVSLTTAAADSEILAAFTALSHLAGALRKSYTLSAFVNLVHPVLIEIPQSIFVQHIKITGIDASVRLHHILDAAEFGQF